MAFKEKSQKEILALTKDEQIKYWTDFKNYVNEKKREITKKKREQEKSIAKKIRERERYEAAKNKRRTDHATFLLFGEMIRHEGIVNFIGKIAESNSFTEREKEDLNLLMKSRGIGVTF